MPVAIAATLLISGCSKTGTVKGKVVMADGTPLPGGTITFTPVEGNGNPASGTIKEDGTYDVSAPTGLCRISIDNRAAGKTFTPVGAGGATAPKDLPKDGSGAQGKAPGMPKGFPMMKGKDTAGPPKENEKGATGIAQMMEGKNVPGGVTTPVPGRAVPINAKYYMPDTSGLELKVKGGSQSHDIKLE